MTGGTATLTDSLALSAQKVLLNTTGALTYGLSPSTKQAVQYGTGSGQFNLLVAMDSRSLAAGAAETFNLFDGSLLDVFGDPANFRLLTAYEFYVVSGGDTGGVTIGNAGSNPHPLFFGAGTHTQTVYPGGSPAGGGCPAGIAVSSTSNQVKVVNNSAVTLTYALFLVGRATAPGAAMGPIGLTYP